MKSESRGECWKGKGMCWFYLFSFRGDVFGVVSVEWNKEFQGRIIGEISILLVAVTLY